MPKVHTGSGRKKKVGWQTWTRTTGIYRIRNLITNERYIGLSKDIGERWKRHLYLLEAGTHHNSPLQESWNEHGITNFAFEVCEVCYKKDLERKETEWWDKEKAEGFSLFNGRPTGGWVEHTDATKRKISETKKGKAVSEEHKRKVSKALTGRKLSEEHKRNVGKAMTGINRTPVIQMDLEGNIISEWSGINEAAKQLGLHSSNIVYCLKGKRKTCGGFKWRYAC